MTDRIAVSKTSPSVTFYLEADVYSYTPSGGYATLVCRLRASKGTGSFFSDFGIQAGVVNGVAEFGRHQADPFLPSGSTGWNDGPFYINVPMSGPGTYGLTMQLRYGNINTDHGGSIWLPWVPGAPNPIGVDELTPTSARYRFSGTTDGGSGITGWQAQIATDASFTQNVQTVASNGTTTFANLTPATVYYFRSRGANGVGWGHWSAVVSGMTASGAYVSLNGAWVPVPVYVSDGSAPWIVPEMLTSDGSAPWNPAI